MALLGSLNNGRTFFPPDFALEFIEGFLATALSPIVRHLQRYQVLFFIFIIYDRLWTQMYLLISYPITVVPLVGSINLYMYQIS